MKVQFRRIVNRSMIKVISIGIIPVYILIELDIPSHSWITPTTLLNVNPMQEPCRLVVIYMELASLRGPGIHISWWSPILRLRSGTMDCVNIGG